MKYLYILFCCLNSLTFFSQIPTYVPASGLVGYWPFTGNANDQSPNLNNGVVTGASLTQDRFGNSNSAYDFNGTSDFITVPNSNSLSGFNDMSISIWVNMAQYSGIQAFVYKWQFNLSCGGNTDNYAASMWNNTIILTTNYDNTTGYTAPQTFTSADLNKWKHFVFVSNSTQGMSIYINGVLSGTGGSMGNLCASINDMYFGVATANQRFYKGKLDDIGIWNRALTSCEIADLYYGTSISPVTSGPGICAGNSATLTAGAGATNYLWNTTATTSVIVVSPTVTTNYTVTETNTLTSCSNTVVLTQSVSLCTGIENFDLNNSISLYPNPSNGNFTIKSDLIFSNYEITNMLGQLIAAGSIENNTIDAGNLAPGIYNISLVSDKFKARKKIIIE